MAYRCGRKFGNDNNRDGSYRVCGNYIGDEIWRCPSCTATKQLADKPMRDFSEPPSDLLSSSEPPGFKDRKDDETVNDNPLKQAIRSQYERDIALALSAKEPPPLMEVIDLTKHLFTCTPYDTPSAQGAAGNTDDQRLAELWRSAVAFCTNYYKRLT